MKIENIKKYEITIFTVCNKYVIIAYGIDNLNNYLFQVIKFCRQYCLACKKY